MGRKPELRCRTGSRRAESRAGPDVQFLETGGQELDGCKSTSGEGVYMARVNARRYVV